MTPPDAESRLATLSLLLQEISAELRSRRDPEHLYTAALIGALGAVAWGVATIATVEALTKTVFWQHPALVGAFACLVMSIGVWLKVQREHNGYVNLRKDHVRIAALVASAAGIEQSELSQGLRQDQIAGNGHLYSGIVIASSAVASFLFCLSIWFART